MTILETRTNYYDGNLLPEHASDELFWPTDNDFLLISNVIISKDYKDFIVKLHGETAAIRVLEHFENIDRYEWFAEHLKSQVRNYALALTSAMIFNSLQKFEEQVVKPWLIESVN